MICPRCGTIPASDAVKCARCGGLVSRRAKDAADDSVSVPVLRAPTQRGELAQRAAGVVPQILARPKPKADLPVVGTDWAAPVGSPSPGAPPAAYMPAGAPPATSQPPAPATTPQTSPPPVAPMPTPPPAPAQSTAAPTAPWPPPPATWAPAPSGGWAPPSAAPAPAGASAPAGAPTSNAGPGWAPPQAGGWANPTWRHQAAGGPYHRQGAYTGTPPSYFWQSLACLFLLLPLGAVAVFYSLLVTRRAQSGDHPGAARASQLARLWCLVTLVVFTVVVVLSAVAGLSS